MGARPAAASPGHERQARARCRTKPPFAPADRSAAGKAKHGRRSRNDETPLSVPGCRYGNRGGRGFRDLMTAADRNPDLRPRGYDDRFIEIGGFVCLLTGTKEKRLGRDRDLSNARGQVIDIDPDPKTPGEPNVRVKGKDTDGKAFEITVETGPDRPSRGQGQSRHRTRGGTRGRGT